MEEATSRNICPKCNETFIPPRIDRIYLIHQLSGIFSLDRGFLFTLAQMCLHPGLASRNFITGERKRYMKPVIFLFLCSLIYTFLENSFHFEEETYESMGVKKDSGMIFINWIREHYGYMNIFTSVLTAFWIKLFFKKSKYNLYEIIVLVCFFSGTSTLMYGLFGVLQSTTGYNTYIISWFLSFAYSVWATGQFFDAQKLKLYWKGLFANALGYLTFAFIIFTITIGILMFKGIN